MGRASALALNALAVVLFGVGVVAPLTPSQGVPRAVDLLVFAGVPAALLLAGLVLEHHRAVRALWGVQLALLGMMLGWLLGMQAGTG